jgi:hypothetical protein
VAGLIESTSGGFKFPDGTTQTTAVAGSSFIQNTATPQASSNFNISGNGTVGGTLNSSMLRQELTASAPNLIQGFLGNLAHPTGNQVTAGVAGATIGGGGYWGTITTANLALSGRGINEVTDYFGTVGGGYLNLAGNVSGALDDASFATVSGGSGNTASGSRSTVGGGFFNNASGIAATVPGGESNSASGNFSFAAGWQAKANHQGAFVWADSTAADFASTAANQFIIRAAGGVGIGLNNPTSPLTVNGVIESKAGGIKFPDGTTQTTAAAGSSFIQNTTTPQASSNFNISGNGTVGGTLNGSALRQELTAAAPNIISGFQGTGSSGATPGNRVTAGVEGASIGGGGGSDYLSNRITDSFGTVSGGAANRVGNDDATISNARYATVGGGVFNVASGEYTTVAGGGFNTASGLSSSTIGGGSHNTASNAAATVGGGNTNTASGISATISGGAQNTASGSAATVAGGANNTASGDFSFAAGSFAKANHQSAFVWADTTQFADFASTANHQFLIRASGGVGIGLNNPSSPLTVNGVIESKAGGIKFPDGTTQTTAATGGGGGTITGVTAGTGLTGGGTSGAVTVGLATGGVSANELATNAVTTAKLADGNVTDAKIASVAGSKITSTIPVAGVPAGRRRQRRER